MTTLAARARTFGPPLAAALLAGVLYAGTLGHGFAYDDALNIGENPLVLEHRFAAIVTHSYHQGPYARVETGAWRPLTGVSYAANHALSGAAPRGYHATNVALHALASALVAMVAALAGLGASGALAAGLLFAAHPVHVEVVANVSGRPESLCAVFFLGALAALLAWRSGRIGPGLGTPLVALGAFAAMAAKETAVVFPVVALAAEAWAPLPRGAGARARFSASASPALVYLALRLVVLGSWVAPAASVTPAENPVVGLGPVARTATVAAVLARASGLLVAPVRLTPDYGPAEIVPVASLLDPRWMAGAAVAAGLVAAFLASRRRRPLAAFLLVLGAAPYALTSNALVTIGTIFGERLLYLPSAALCLGLGAVVDAARGRRTISVLLSALVVVASVKTVVAAAAWRDDLTLFRTAAAQGARGARVLGNLGAELALRGESAEAERVLREAVAAAPDLAPPRINLAGVLLARGAATEAAAEARRALASDPSAWPAWLHLARALEALGETAEAAEARRRAEEIRGR